MQRPEKGTEGRIMRGFARWTARLLLLGAVALGAVACEGMQRAYDYDGATPGTVPGHDYEPSGPMYNGIMPEPWGSTS